MSGELAKIKGETDSEVVADLIMEFLRGDAESRHETTEVCATEADVPVPLEKQSGSAEVTVSA